MSAPDGNVSALVALIVNAAKTVEETYAKSSAPYVPSLDDLSPHPLDTQPSTPQLRDAISILEGACAQLAATVARPAHTVVNRAMGIYESTSLHVVTTFKIPDVLLAAPQGMHISEIGKKSGLDPEKLGRILRLLASKHIFREVKPDVFANNRLSLQLLSTNPVSSLALHFLDECNKSATRLPEVLGDPVWGPSQSVTQTSFNKAYDSPHSLFQWYEGAASEEGAAKGARFGIAMLGWTDAVEAANTIEEFPWNDLPPKSTICDVGGGIGAITMQLANRYPHLHFKLQDTPERVVQAEKEVWPKDCPQALKDGRIEFKAMDFLQESPIPSCDVYLLKNIIHDWPDKECVMILSGVRQALKPTSRVLVHECVLQHANRVAATPSGFQQAPEPLLPNYGLGRIRQYYLDIDMMIMLNSKERTLQEHITLGEQAGLRFVKLWNSGGDMGLVEFALAE